MGVVESGAVDEVAEQVKRPDRRRGASGRRGERHGSGWARRVTVTALAGALLLLAACGQPVASMLDQLQPAADLSAAAMKQSLQLRAAQNSAVAWAHQQLVLRQAANWYLERMSLDDQLGQMLLNEANGPSYNADMARQVEQQHIGGIILFPGVLGSSNFSTFDGTRQLMHDIQAHATIPLFLATDQEGGGISRVNQFFGDFPWPRDLASTGDPNYAYSWGVRTAQDLQQLGINTNFAPIVDVSVNGGMPWSPARTFSDDPQTVGVYAGAFMHGEQSVGEIAVLKHFPGLGSVVLDPHKTLPVVDRTLAQIQASEMVPYKMLIPQHPDMIMSTDVLMTAVDANLPAELSPAWVTGVLRKQLGYQGVVITDALWMDGISQHWNLGQAAVMAVQAGSDIMIAAYSADSNQFVLNSLHAAIASGQISRARIAESVQRILMVKIKYGLLPLPDTVMRTQPQVSA